MDRLTKYSDDTVHENGVCCTHFGSLECYKYAGNCSLGCEWEEKAWSKLAHYEDLEESGRLVVLPSGVTGKQLCKIVNACPSILGLKNNCGSHSCESCWEAALRGEEEC